jgi:hypothetical protein
MLVTPFSSYNLALRENLSDLIDDVKRGTYAPEKPTVVYQPKKSGILRPLTLLSLQDLIVYQAIVNRIAVAFQSEQKKHAYKTTFGAIFAGPSSPFFYRSWKTSYKRYNKAITTAFNAGNNFLADFDLVSFYELIEHDLLADRLGRKVRSRSLITLLLECLKKWTSDRAGAHVGHGVPQGPEPSAFLAECFLLHFDEQDYRTVRYFRYVDDIRLMAKDESQIRRALLKLDLQSKDLGLVPQAQKIVCRKVADIDEVLKNIPSPFAGSITDDGDESKKPKQDDLLKMFRQSMKKESGQWVIQDNTQFKFSLNRLNARKDVLKRIAPFLNARPDLSWVLANYIKKFECDREAADTLLAALKRDPTYDAAAANYIDAMDICEPQTGNSDYRRVIETANRRSEEKSILLRIASSTFRGRRRSASEALKLIEAEPDARTQSILIHRLFGVHPAATFTTVTCRHLLEHCTESKDPDLARLAASLLLDEWPWKAPSWVPSTQVNRSVALLLQALGLRRRAPKKKGVLEQFFHVRYQISIEISWRKALGQDWREAERRCLKLQQLLIGDPTTRITLLDTFNELLLQNFSAKHLLLSVPYAKAKGAAAVPDLGNWVNNGALTRQLPRGSKWFGDVHNARVTGELAHAKGKKTGKTTRPISFKKADALMKGAQSAWAELITEWKKFL